MAKTRSDKILLKGHPIQSEGQASAAISPGHCIEFGGAKDVQVQSTARQNAALRIAVENDMIGKTKEDAYAANDNVYFFTPQKGDQFQVRLPASAAAIVKGDQLELTGDGTFRKLTGAATDGAQKVEALEDVDNSAGGTEVFINVEAI